MSLARFTRLALVGELMLFAAGLAGLAGVPRAYAQPNEDASTQPIDAASTQPIDDASTQPIDAASAQPIDAVSTQPIDAASTQPIDAASTQPIDDARAAFEEGRFLEAADIAEALGSSAGYALAAQSLAVYSHYIATGDDRKEILERAMRLGEEAVRADSTNHEAYYQSAHAVGRYAQNVGIMTALRRGLAGRTRGLLEAALAIDPDFAGAHMAFGGWHADIASAGRIARFLYKGNREDAVIHYERAMELAPESKAVLLEYALRLPKLDREDGRARARALLSKAAELPAPDAYGELIQQAVLDALAELEDDG